MPTSVVDPSTIRPCWDPSRSDCPGHDPRRCKGHKDGRPCKNYPIKGAKVCKNHGGNAGQVKRAAAIRQAEERVRVKVGRMTSEPVHNPVEKLQELAGRVHAWMAVCEEHVAELERLRYSTEGGEHIRGEVILFERALDACRKVLVEQIRLGIDERLADATKRYAASNAALIQAVLRRAGLEVGGAQVQQWVVEAIAEVTGERMTIEGSAA